MSVSGKKECLLSSGFELFEFETTDPTTSRALAIDGRSIGGCAMGRGSGE